MLEINLGEQNPFQGAGFNGVFRRIYPKQTSCFGLGGNTHLLLSKTLIPEIHHWIHGFDGIYSDGRRGSKDSFLPPCLRSRWVFFNSLEGLHNKAQPEESLLWEGCKQARSLLRQAPHPLGKQLLLTGNNGVFPEPLMRSRKRGPPCANTASV